MKTSPPTVSASSLDSAHRNQASESFDEKTHRFNRVARLVVRDGRNFRVQEPRVIEDFDWGRVYLVEMELLESNEQYQMPFEVKICWEEMYGHTAPPSEECLQRMARTVIGSYLESHRIARSLSCHTNLIKLQIPEERKPMPWVHPHNY